MLLDVKPLADELAKAKFADERLKRRLGLLAERMSATPDLSFPKALSSAELEGAYRFFGNPVVTPQGILSGHFGATRGRCEELRRALVIHDTTTVKYSEDGEREGLGRLMRNGQAFFVHVGLVLSDDGERRLQGIASFHAWARTDEAKGTEQLRWRRGVDEAASNLGDARLIHIMDREGDDYALFSHLVSNNHSFVIRAAHDRRLVDESGMEGKLRAAVATVEHVVERDAKLSKRVAKKSPKQTKIHPARKARTAQLAVSACPITLLRPKPHPRDSAEKRALNLPPTLDVNVVRVWEPEPPEGEEPVEWLLLTSEPIDTIENALKIVEHYRARWTIEEYFKVLKTGCHLEARQLGDFESLVNAAALFAPIACNMLSLRTIARVTPEAPASSVASVEQIEVLRALGRRPLPPSPTARDIFLAIAELGGYIRYAATPPGWITLARGYQELVTLTLGWTAAKLQLSRDQR